MADVGDQGRQAPAAGAVDGGQLDVTGSVSTPGSATTASIDEVREQALALMDGVGPGEPLDAATAALIGLGVAASLSALDSEGTRRHADAALAAGASAEQLSEVLMLVAGLGVHSLMQGARDLQAVLEERGEADDRPLDERRRRLWDEHVGSDPYWEGFEQQVPGFLEALLRQSPESFEAFFAICAVPWRMGTLPARTKELIALATDSMPAHRYLPGVRIHVLGALRTGAGRVAIEAAIGIGAAAAPPGGVA
jgi:alkylhydroperoxidase/carboxymuconolactone decarboxylase family protein YurZ